MTDLHEPNLEEERRLAHTGALAGMASHFAHHPWRVISGWIAIFVVLIGLNAAFHGKLINDFNIPGSDVQKATDLINAKFGGQKGAALRVVPQGVDHPDEEVAVLDALKREMAPDLLEYAEDTRESALAPAPEPDLQSRLTSDPSELEACLVVRNGRSYRWEGAVLIAVYVLLTVTFALAGDR